MKWPDDSGDGAVWPSFICLSSARRYLRVI